MQSTYLLLHNYTAFQNHSNDTKVRKYKKTSFKLKEAAKHQQVQRRRMTQRTYFYQCTWHQSSKRAVASTSS